jgi:hypothetical protein
MQKSFTIGSGKHTIRFNYHHPGMGWASGGTGIRLDMMTVTYGSAKAKGMGAKKTGRVWVTTSDGSEGGAVADGDEGTGWSPSGAGGAWVALSFEEARDVGSVEVAGEDLPEGMRTLVSQDGDNWSEEGGEAVNYLWVILPDEGAVPTVREIVTKP